MILSQESIFSDAQELASGAATSTNVMRLVKRGQPELSAAPFIGDIGKGNPVPLLIQVVEDFAGTGALVVNVETGDTDALGTVVASVSIPADSLVAGYRSTLAFLPEGITGEYLGLTYESPGAGKITAGIVGGRQTNGSGF